MDAVDDRTGVRLFRYAAWAALVALFLVTVTGATVRLTGSGLGCENWPRCGEQVLPEAEAGYHAYVEFGNRVVGFAVGLTTLAAAAIAWRARVPRGIFRLALSLPFLVLAQGVLGRDHRARGAEPGHRHVALPALARGRRRSA